MNKTLKVTITTIFAAATGCAVTISAQSLKKDITVVHDYEPEYVEVSPMPVNPAVTLPADTVRQLNYSGRRVSVTPESGITPLPSAPYADSIYTTPYRGYAALGFMPKFNMAASAGYKILDTDRTRLNGWLQYDGAVYSNPAPSPDHSGNLYVRRHTATLGAQLHQAVGRESYIDLGGTYTYNRFNTPALGDIDNQNANRVSVSGTWSSSHDRWNYGAGIDYRYFGYGNSLRKDATIFRNYEYYPAASENMVALKAYGTYRVSSTVRAGLAFRYAYTGQDYGAVVTPDYYLVSAAGNRSYSLLTLTPKVRIALKDIDFDLGARIDAVLRDGGNKFHIAPAVKAVWSASKFTKLYVKATGGEWQNTLGSLFDVTPYTLPVMAYGSSHIPVEGAIGVSIGDWLGFHARIEGSYSIASHWLMPLDTYSDGTVFTSRKMKGYRVTVEAGYDYRGIVSFDASFSLAPQKSDQGYYLWRDRARYVTGARLKVTPVKTLDLKIGWEYRGDRAEMKCDAYHNTWLYSIGSVNNLSAGALYRITERWSAFLTGDNLLNHKHTLLGGMPAQGVTGLVGATYKF